MEDPPLLFLLTSHTGATLAGVFFSMGSFLFDPILSRCSCSKENMTRILYYVSAELTAL